MYAIIHRYTVEKVYYADCDWDKEPSTRAIQEVLNGNIESSSTKIIEESYRILNEKDYKKEKED